MVSLDCIPETEKPGKSGFRDQEILVSGFFRDQDLRNPSTHVSVKFVHSVPNSHEVMSKKRFSGISVFGAKFRSCFWPANFKVAHFAEL